MRGATETASSLSNPRNQLVRDEILTKAAEVFEKRGFAQTRIQDIAQALDLSRSALYHYFKSKDEMLASLVQEHTSARLPALAELASAKTRPAGERLREALRRTIEIRLASGSRLRALDRLTAEMPEDLRKRFDKDRRRILDLYADIVADGIAEGEFRDVDTRTAALALLGLASWTSWWYSPDGRRSPDELTQALVDIALNGLVRPDGCSKPLDRAALLARVRADLDAIEHL